jgi:hypothetical protein
MVHRRQGDTGESIRYEVTITSGILVTAEARRRAQRVPELLRSQWHCCATQVTRLSSSIRLRVSDSQELRGVELLTVLCSIPGTQGTPSAAIPSHVS